MGQDKLVIGDMYYVPWSPNPHRLDFIRPRYCQMHGELLGLEAGFIKKRNSQTRPWGSTSVVMASHPGIRPVTPTRNDEAARGERSGG